MVLGLGSISLVVAVLVLGPVEVMAQGANKPIGSNKQQLIMAHLSLAGGEPVSADLLIDELWNTTLNDPLHALQSHVSRLRRTTTLPIEHTAHGYQLDASEVVVDAVRFEDLLRSGTDSNNPESTVRTMEEALGLWRGPALAGLPDTPGLHAHRNRLGLLREQAVTELVEAHLAADDPDAALPLLQEFVELTPLDERRWAQLMVALDRTGKRGLALDAYARARAQLSEHLGLEPNAQLQQLQHEILVGAQTHGPSADPIASSGSEPPPDLVGRDDMWETLTHAWLQAHSRQRIAVISGEPGIGKTYLASRFAGTLSNVPVRWSRCHAAHGAPYELLAQLLRSDCEHLSPEQLAQRLGPGAVALRGLIPDLVTGLRSSGPVLPDQLDPQVERHRIKLALVHWLRDATRSGPICLLLDDLQWADADSLHLLTDLWSQPEELPILWIVTLRDREHLAASPRAVLVDRAVRPSESVVRVSLEGLDRSAAADLMLATAEAAGDQQLSLRTVDEVLVATAGNPLFILETARHLQGRESEDGPVVLQPVPPSLAAIVDSHVKRLGPSARDLLDVAAVVGEEFDPTLVATASDRGPQELDEFLVTAQHLRLLEPVGIGTVQHRFRHSLVHAAVLQGVAPMRRAHLHLRVAGAVEVHPNIAERLHLLAHHHAQAVSLTGPDLAIEHILAAAEASLQQRAPAIALDLYRQACALLTAESPAGQRCEVHLGLGRAGFWSGTDYRDDLLTAARLADEMGDVDRLVRAAITNNRGWYSSIAEVDRDRVAVIEVALAKLPEGVEPEYRPARSRLLSLWAMENVRDATRRAEALHSSAESWQIAEQLDDEELLGEIMCHRYSVLYATLADPVKTFDFAKQVDQFAHARIAPDLQLNTAIALAQSAMMMGDFTTADRALERCERLAAEQANMSRRWLVRTWTAARAAMRGDLTGARAQAADALEMGIAFDQPDAFTWYAGQLFAFHHVSGRLPELIDAVEEQAAALTAEIPAWRAAYALTLTSVDRWPEAQAIIEEFRATQFAQLPVDVLYLHGLSYLAEAAVEMGYRAPVQDLYAALLPYAGLVANNATIDAGPVDLRLGTLACLASDHASARRHLRDAESFCRTNDAASWLEHVLKAQSRLL